MRTEAYKVDYEAVVDGYWEGFTARCLTKDSANGRAELLTRTGGRNVQISRDPQNDGQKLGM